jgi:murein DD-endopeptidase MepM/ murein hydrolase activator NlpD
MRLNRFLLSALLFSIAAAALCPESRVHVVEKGQTIYGIARTYGVPFESILAANGIEDPRRILPGTRLVIPFSHKVAKGETLYGIARVYGVPLENILKANKLAPNSLIKPGDLLVIPGGGTRDSPPSPAAGDPAPASGGGGPSTLPITKPGTKPVPADPAEPAAKPPAKPPAGGVWPATGEAVYLDGKLFGVGIRTEENIPIRAVRSGTVISAGPFRGYGRVAFVQAKDGLVYVYGGAQNLSVRIGESVRSGTEIGRAGLDLKEGRPIVYFLVFKQGNPLDPAKVPRE